MVANANELPAGGSNTQPLWAAITVLGVAVIALGAGLIHVQTRPVDGLSEVAALQSPELAAGTQDPPPVAAPLPVATVAPGETVVTAKPSAKAAAKAQKSVATGMATPVKSVAQAAPPSAPVAAPAWPVTPSDTLPAPAAEPVRAPYVVTNSGPLASRALNQVPRTVCANCGLVESVIPVQRKGPSNGVGAVAGGVLGAVVGNQIGKGSGRSIATILGAVGGGVAGNAIEKNMTRVTVYQVRVRMDDGSVRSIEQAQAPALGSAIVVQDQNPHSADARPAPVAESRNLTYAPTQGTVYTTERN